MLPQETECDGTDVTSGGRQFHTICAENWKG